MTKRNNVGPLMTAVKVSVRHKVSRKEATTEQTFTFEGVLAPRVLLGTKTSRKSGRKQTLVVTFIVLSLEAYLDPIVEVEHSAYTFAAPLHFDEIFFNDVLEVTVEPQY